MVPPLEETRKILEKLSTKHEEVIEQEVPSKTEHGCAPLWWGPRWL